MSYEKISTTEQFNELIQSDKEIIVKFFADWCPDCTRMNMFIGDILEEYNQNDWYELNRDELPELADKYQVMGIPSLLIFKNGEKKAHLHSANAKTPEEVTEFLSQHI
ncbi:thioredoxin family protein [Bacillus velezensis]|nr:thiol reductase thioredoxin [Bacillus velezensis]MBV2197891.1 thioredoxin family protein [Bacillus velezensis]MCE4148059.1 thioredoxin family protein [Bacillus velezensis]MCE4148065.1 thioredoxin family protein [Bacillus velezensis]QPQ07238.1 thioredoxin family protein [Bacillus velezensis]